MTPSLSWSQGHGGHGGHGGEESHQPPVSHTPVEPLNVSK